MPIKIHDNLPARKLLQNEIVDVIDSSTAEKQDIRPLKFLLLNLMPKNLKLRCNLQVAWCISFANRINFNDYRHIFTKKY